MEASEVHEFSEQLQEGAEKRLKYVSLVIAVLAVAVALVTVLGHRAHTQAVLEQTRTDDSVDRRSNVRGLVSGGAAGKFGAEGYRLFGNDDNADGRCRRRRRLRHPRQKSPRLRRPLRCRRQKDDVTG